MVLAACGGPARQTRTVRLEAGKLRHAEPTVQVTPARPVRGTMADRCRAVEPAIRRAAARWGADPDLVAAIVRVESGFRPDAVSRSGALGLMQVLPSNGERLGCGPLDEVDPNLACGLEVLRRFLDHYDGDLVLGLSAYNAGYRAPNRARASGKRPANMAYVEKVLAARAAFADRGCGP